MVDTSHLISPSSQFLLTTFTRQLEQLAQQSLTSQRLVQLAEECYWRLIEGEYRQDFSPEVNQLRSLLSDITAQWEILLGNLHEQPEKPLNRAPEFSPEWIDQWLEQIQAIEATPMAESSKNQPTFRIGQVGNINSGDVTIKGDQVGIQHHYATNTELNTVLQELKDSLADLQKHHPTITTETQAYEIIDAEIINPTTPNATKLATLGKQFLNPDRHLKASKATLAEIAKHYLEESVWAKAFITYLDTMSADPGKGA